jgi:hypothetical protein
MAKATVNSILNPLSELAEAITKYTSKEAFITDLLSKFLITFGTVLIVGGLFLMLSNASNFGESSKIAIDALSWVPGVPFNLGDLVESSASAIGLIIWIVGIDLLVVGLGFWSRHVLARWAGLTFFSMSAIFQSIQFLYFGIGGVPASTVILLIDMVIIYFVFAKFDLKRKAKDNGIIKELN